MANEGIVLRRVAQNLSLRRRFQRLTADDVVRAERLKKIMLLFALKIRRAKESEDKKEEKKVRTLLSVVYTRYVSLVYYVQHLHDCGVGSTVPLQHSSSQT
jgi:hypothetical protein